MPLIGRAWKANANVWKRHLTLQSVFNRGECMMHENKNVDGHVLDQNVDRISREIAYIPLSGGSGLNVVHPCNLFFFLENFFFEYKTCLPVVWWIWSFGCAYQRSDGFEICTCFPKVQWIWNLDVLPRGLMVWSLDVLPRGLMDLKFGRASQRFIEIEFGCAS